MTGEVLVRVEGVSKKFCRKLKRSLWYGVKDIGGELIGLERARHELRADEFWACKDVSFTLRRGECLGLIGRNGAGKTTLLRMLSGLIRPDGGRIEMRGRVGALISLGAGFSPVLTGRENIYVNGSILGLKKKEIDRQLDRIIDFAEVEKFIDSPVQSYSSGMQVRLGFAVATALAPDILLLDEVLAVGDVGFRIKCYNRIAEIKENTAVILVSHNMFDISTVSTHGCVLEHGVIRFDGQINQAIEAYNELINLNAEPFSFVVPDLSLNRFAPLQKDVSWGSSPSFAIDFLSRKQIDDVFIRLMFTDIAGNVIAEWNSKKYEKFYQIVEGHNEITFTVDNLRLRNDKYSVVMILTKGSGRETLINLRFPFEIQVTGGIYTSSNYLI